MGGPLRLGVLSSRANMDSPVLEPCDDEAQTPPAVIPPDVSRADGRSGEGAERHITASAWEEAIRCTGAEVAAIVVAAILQRFGRITNPGGYLRALSAKAAQGGYLPGPMVMALLSDPGRAVKS